VLGDSFDAGKGELEHYELEHIRVRLYLN
jgi:hypothetical protein